MIIIWSPQRPLQREAHAVVGAHLCGGLINGLIGLYQLATLPPLHQLAPALALDLHAAKISTQMPTRCSTFLPVAKLLLPPLQTVSCSLRSPGIKAFPMVVCVRACNWQAG